MTNRTIETAKFDRLVAMALNGMIPKETSITKRDEINEKLSSIEIELKMLSEVTGDFKNTLTTAFYLASRAYFLFKSSKSNKSNG